MKRAILDALRHNNLLLRELALQYGAATEFVPLPSDPQQVRSPADVDDLLRAEMVPLKQEQLRVLLLDTKQHLVAVQTVYQGTVNCTSVRIAEVLRPAIIENCPNMIIVHNHPSGEPTPSPEDIRITSRLRRAAELIDVCLEDHVVLARHGFVSMKTRGLGFPDS